MLDDDGTERAVDEDVLDAVAELTNMIVGNIKNILEEKLGTMAISIPTVVYGRNFKFKSFAGITDSQRIFTWQNYSLKVQVCLAPTSEHASNLRHRVSAPVLVGD
jgi:chemotaxis protein CheX